MRANLVFRASALWALSIGIVAAPASAQNPVPLDIGPVAPVSDPVSDPAPDPISDRETQGYAEATGPDEGRLVIDILAQVEPEMSPGEKLAYEACVAEQDAARLRGEIIVCRQREDGAAYSGFDKKEWERDYAQRTQGLKQPNLDSLAGGPLYRTEGSVIMVSVKMKVGDPPPPALIIDVSALPTAPPGSDADRIAKGLQPLGEED